METAQLYKLFQKHPIISTDSRKIIPNSIFFGLKGENFNGNTFATKAIEQGAAYAIVDEKEYANQSNIIYVANTLKSLQQLANYHRKQLTIPIIGITGSNGKTTTKELIFSVLSKKYNTLATIGNLNNHIGVPLTLLNINKNHEMAIIEMGANHTKEIEFLCNIAEPNYGIITNIGKAHIEGFGSFEGVIKTKSELYKSIEFSSGTLFVNEDDDLLMSLSKATNCVYYGKSASFCNAELISNNPVLKLKWKDNIITTQLYGSYNFPNILAALCLGSYFKVEENKIVEAISEYTSTNNRSQLVSLNSNLFYLDAYNANPSSMEVAISGFIENQNQHKLMVLGDMLELGNISKQEHQHIIEKAILAKIKTLFVGKNFNDLALNYKNEHIHFLSNYKEAAEWIINNNIKNSSILIKGSRGIQLEKIIPLL